MEEDKYHKIELKGDWSSDRIKVDISGVGFSLGGFFIALGLIVVAESLIKIADALTQMTP